MVVFSTIAELVTVIQIVIILAPLATVRLVLLPHDGFLRLAISPSIQKCILLALLQLVLNLQFVLHHLLFGFQKKRFLAHFLLLTVELA